MRSNATFWGHKQTFSTEITIINMLIDTSVI